MATAIIFLFLDIRKRRGGRAEIVATAKRERSILDNTVQLHTFNLLRMWASQSIHFKGCLAGDNMRSEGRKRLEHNTRKNEGVEG